MKIKVRMSMGLCGCEREDEIEIDDETLEGLDDESRDLQLQEAALDWAAEFMDVGFEIIEDKE